MPPVPTYKQLLGRDTARTVAAWPRIKRDIAPAPTLFRGEVPRKSPPLWKYRKPRYRGQLIGCCVGMSGAACAETTVQTPDPLTPESEPTGLDVAFSELWVYLIGRRWTAEHADPSILRGEGAIVSHALEAVREQGIIDSDAWPATDDAYNQFYQVERSGRLPAGVAEAIRRPVIGDVRRLESADAILQYLAAGYSVWVGTRWPNGAMETRPGRDELPDFAWSGRSVGGHAYELLGYDRDADWVVIGNSWMNAGFGDPERGCGRTKLSTYLREFTAGKMAGGESEAVVVSEVEGDWEPKTDPLDWRDVL